MRGLTLLCLALAVPAAALGQQTELYSVDYLTLKQQCGLVLSSPQFRAAIKPTGDQEGKWKALFQKYSDAKKEIVTKNQGDSDAANNAMTKGLEALDKQTADESIAIANETQRKEVEGIALQRLGVEAFTKDDLLTELKLLPSQIKRVKEIMGEYQTKSQDQDEVLVKAAQNIPDPKPGNEASVKRYNEQVAAVQKSIKGTANDPAVLQKETNAKVMSVLTAEQIANYKALLGKPLKG